MLGLLVVGSGFLNACSAINGISNTPAASSQCFTVKDDRMFIHLKKTNSLSYSGGTLKLSYIDPGTLARTKVLLIHTGNNQYQAYENKCTQCGGELEYDSTSRIINCVSIARSKFNLKGEVIKGPARENLRLFPTSMEGDEIVLDLVT